MQAVITYDTGESKVEDVERPSPEGGEVLVEVKRVQLSVTEYWQWSGEFAMAPSLRRRMDDGGARAFGHEFCGVVSETGSDVVDFEVGDRVYAPGKIPCGECPYCRNDSPFLCENKETLGIEEYPGALAEYVTVPAGPLCLVPDGVSDAEAAALQPLSDALLTVHEADLTTGDVVAVIGAGVMGSQCGQLAQYMGADRVFVIDIDPKKVSMAEDLGLTGVDASETDPVEYVREQTDGVGPDVVFEAVGGNQTHMTEGGDPIAQAFEMVRTGGDIVQVGILTGELTFTPMALWTKGVSVINSTSAKGVLSLGPNTDTGELAARMVETGKVSIDQFITHEVHGLESFDQAIEITSNKDEYGALGPAQIILDE